MVSSSGHAVQATGDNDFTISHRQQCQCKIFMMCRWALTLSNQSSTIALAWVVVHIHISVATRSTLHRLIQDLSNFSPMSQNITTNILVSQCQVPASFTENLHNNPSLHQKTTIPSRARRLRAIAATFTILLCRKQPSLVSKPLPLDSTLRSSRSSHCCSNSMAWTPLH